MVWVSSSALMRRRRQRHDQIEIKPSIRPSSKVIGLWGDIDADLCHDGDRKGVELAFCTGRPTG